jgi:hypothetical protein
VCLPTRPLRQSQIKRDEALKRQAWRCYRSWSRITSGVRLSVLGAVPYDTSKVFYKIVPHFAAQELRPYIHHVMAVFSKTGTEVVMVVDRNGIHRVHKLDATLNHYREKFCLHFLPARGGHHLNPIEGFWRVMKDTIGAGRCFSDLLQLYQRTRRVLMAYQERPIYEFHREPFRRWVATRRGLTKPVSSSPPFKTGLAAFTAPGLIPLVFLRGQTAPRSVPSHFPSSTGVHPCTACAFAGYLDSCLSNG